MNRVSVIIPFRGNPDTLLWVLDGFARQSLPDDISLDIRVGGDGCSPPAFAPSIEHPGIRFTFLSLSRSGVAGAKNLLVDDVHSDVLIFANADTRPDPNFVSAHVRRLLALPANHMVLGSSPYEPTVNPTVFDALKEESPMIFFYDRLRAHHLYDYRHAWNLNVSIRHSDYLRAGGFSAALRPYGYEDLDFAFKVMGDSPAVYYDPHAVVIHRHPMSVDDYLNREEALGAVAPVLACVNPPIFQSLFGTTDLTKLAADYRHWTSMDIASHRWTYQRLDDWARQSETLLGPKGSEERSRLLLTLYQLHIPLKRLAFRLGFLRGLDLMDDSRWLERGATGGWKEAIQ
jgi:GT2 family glycosyltransferase